MTLTASEIIKLRKLDDLNRRIAILRMIREGKDNTWRAK